MLLSFKQLLDSKLLYIYSGCDHLRDVFGHMGLTDQDIVALSGGHTLVCSISFKSSAVCTDSSSANH